MRKFVSASPNAELIGAGLLALIQNINSDEIKPLLVKHGLDNLDPHKWYPEQKALDLLKDISDGKSNVSENMVAIGMKASETMPLPPELNTFEGYLTSYGARQTAASRNTPAALVTRMVGDKKAEVINDTPYPDDLIYGYIWSAARRLLPQGTQFTVRPRTDSNPDGVTVFDVTW